jgi:glycosyltransferase involved in cell wall biosynthesis
MANLRIVYIAGPGDVVGTFRHWQRGEDDPRMPDVAYSRQFLDICRRFDAAAWIISSHPHAEVVQDGAIRVEQRPIPNAGEGGAAFHRGQLRYGVGLVRSILSFRADLVVVAGPGVPWFLMSIPATLGIKVVPALHGTLWLATVPPSRAERALLQLARPLFQHQAFAVLSHPGACVRQLEELTHGKSRPVVPFIPYYRSGAFSGVPERGDPRPPFRVLFVGRIETEKGVFDLLEVARQLRDRQRTDVEIDVCGTGTMLAPLRKAADEAGLATTFRCHGRVEMTVLRALFGRCHVVAVPTRTRYTEGFNAVVGEAILCGRPVVTSRLCPAIELVSDAVVEVEPEDVGGYRDAILRLCDDQRLYQSKRQACDGLRAQFYDRSKSWGAGLEGIIEAALRQARRGEVARAAG